MGMKRKSIVLIWMLAFSFSLSVSAQTVISVEDFGLKPNTFADVTAKVSEAIKTCKSGENTILVFPAGRYDFWPEKADKREFYVSNTSSEIEVLSKTKTLGLLLDGMNGLTIEGNGSLFVFHGKMTTFAIVNSRNITLQNISFDFERPTMSEMTLREVGDEVMVADIHPDSKYMIINGKLKWYGEGWGKERFHSIKFRPGEGTGFYSSWSPFDKATAEVVAPLRVKFTGDFRNHKFIPGDVLTTRDPYRDQVGAFINRSSNINLRNVAMQYMHGLGIVNQFSENLTFSNVTVAPRPESGRVIAAFADCMHFSGCKGQITIENCRFRGAHDDPVNVHGTHLKVLEVLSPRELKVRFMHHQTYGFEAFLAGDTVGFVSASTLEVYGRGAVTSGRLVSEREMVVEMQQPVPASLEAGDVLENITWNPSVTIRNCRFEQTNTRGLLITTRGKVIIENNEFMRTGMHGILIANDASSWYESGPVQDVVIRNNLFEYCGYNSAPNNYVINIAPENHELVNGLMIHRNILIEENTFRVYDTPVLSARSTENLRFIHNRIIRADFAGLPRGNRPAFNLTGCRKVEITKNLFEEANKPAIIMSHMGKADLKTDIGDLSHVD